MRTLYRKLLECFIGDGYMFNFAEDLFACQKSKGFLSIRKRTVLPKVDVGYEKTIGFP
jgi:hypothetical protein